MSKKEKRAKVISLINMKGGVGKTTLTVNLALAISKQKEKRILVIDIDPQFNTTQSLLKYFNLLDKYFDFIQQKQSIVTVFEQRKQSYLHTVPIEPVIINPVIELSEFLSLIPGDLELTNEIDSTRAERLKLFLEEQKLVDDYDLIFIDCPPTWSLYSQAALKTSDYFVVPSRIDEFSLYGIKILLDKVSDILPSNEALKCLGVVYTMISETQSKEGINYEQRKNKEKIEEFFKELEVQESRIFIEPFTTSTSFYPRLSYETIDYSEYEHRKPEVYQEILDLSKELVSKL